jgi:hypothetical protein
MSRRLVLTLIALSLFLVGCTSSAPPPTDSLDSPPTDSLDSYIGVDYGSPDGALVLHIYPQGDEVCQGLDLAAECYRLSPADDPLDLGAQGSAAMQDGLVALTNTQCAYCNEGEVGSTSFFEPREGGAILYGLRCEPAGVSCPDQGLAYERQD